MLKRHVINKISISTAVLFSLFLIYLIPSSNENKLTNIKQELSYVDKELDTENIYLLDKNNMLARTNVVVNNKDTLKRANELLFKWFSRKKYETKNKSKLFKYEKSRNDFS